MADNFIPLRSSSSLAINAFDEFINDARSEAQYVVTLDRDNEKYELQTSTFPKLELSKFPSNQQVFKMIPSGSSWKLFEGWHSYFAIPFEEIDSYKVKDWIFFGCEEISQTVDSKRGPSPILRAYCFRRTKTALDLIVHVLENINRSLLSQSDKKEFEINDEDTSLLERGFIRSLATTPEQHIPVERYIIKKAIESYRKNLPILFRTLLVSENQKPVKQDRPFFVAFREAASFGIDPSLMDRMKKMGGSVKKTFNDLNKKL